MKTTGVAKGVYPINTGKVLIGRDYIPKKPHYTTEAELWMQGAVRPVKPSTSVIFYGRRLFNVLRALRSFFRG